MGLAEGLTRVLAPLGAGLPLFADDGAEEPERERGPKARKYDKKKKRGGRSKKGDKKAKKGK